MTVDERYQRLEDTVRAYNPTASFDKIRAAYEFAAAAHQGQLRKDGSPFVTHPLAVAQIVAEELHLDSESIEAALLHDTIEDTSATHEDIAKQFSPTVADLVEGVSKLTRVHYTSKAQEQMENLRKMLLAMSGCTTCAPWSTRPRRSRSRSPSRPWRSTPPSPIAWACRR